MLIFFFTSLDVWIIWGWSSGSGRFWQHIFKVSPLVVQITFVNTLQAFFGSLVYNDWQFNYGWCELVSFFLWGFWCLIMVWSSFHFRFFFLWFSDVFESLAWMWGVNPWIPFSRICLLKSLGKFVSGNAKIVKTILEIIYEGTKFVKVLKLYMLMVSLVFVGFIPY